MARKVFLVNKIVISSINTLVTALQASIAPVTLISGIGFLALVMSNRYGRVIDRIRVLLRQTQALSADHPEKNLLLKEIQILYKRANLLRVSAILAGASIFCVVLTIFVVFASLMFDVSLNYVAEIAFVLSLTALFLFVGIFIREFGISVHAVKFEIEHGLRCANIQADVTHCLLAGDEP